MKNPTLLSKYSKRLARKSFRKRLSNKSLKSYDEVQRSLVTYHNPVPYKVTEANVENINPKRVKGIYGKNPNYDAVQRTFERKDTGTAPSYRDAVLTFAGRVADVHVRQARMRCDHLRHEFVDEIMSAVGDFVAVRMSRFPRLARDLLARFACAALPRSTLKEMHRVARRACDARMSRMAGKSMLVEPTFFNMFTDESAERSSELDMVFVNSRIDYLLGLVRERGAINGNSRRAAEAHTGFLGLVRSYFAASISGHPVKLPSAGLVPVQVPVAFNITRYSVGGKQVRCSGEIVTEQRGLSLAHNALYKRVARLASFVGAQDVQDALGCGMRTHG